MSGPPPPSELRGCSRHADGAPFTECDASAENLKDYYRDDARSHEELRNIALWPAGSKDYTAAPRIPSVWDMNTSLFSSGLKFQLHPQIQLIRMAASSPAI